MSEVSDIINSNKIILYAFRFGTSDKLVHLTQQQLDRIPYLCALVAHKDDFLLNQNEYGEYVLHHLIEYTWFMPIFRSITSEHPYTLFNEVPEDDNILNTLKLFDFLCIDLFPLPMLKNTSLALSNRIKTDNDENRVNNGAQSAGSGRFNKLPIRFEVNDFKRRFGPKSQRYR
ncbi:unnamed protein product [Rotaria sordida]|uniref:Uncharacterized protein n=2 Tax=Rotaria sordida TaxID=392033 RepID=A0A815L8W0_9BILA|nr:unnamed protein product [Rotaria sordida]